MYMFSISSELSESEAWSCMYL